MTLYSKVLGEWNLFPTDQMTADLEMATKQAEGCEPGSPEDSFLTAIRSMIEASLPKLVIGQENMTMTVGPDQRSLSTSVLHQNADTVVLAVVDEVGTCGQAMLQMDGDALVIEGIDDEPLRFNRSQN